MKSITFFILVFLFVPSSWSQSLPDTLNRLDSKERKTGYWLTYLDSNLVKTEKSTAVYGGYEHYSKGKRGSYKFAKKNKWEGAKLVYNPNSHVYLDSVLLLDGDMTFSYDDSLYVLERFRNGHATYAEDHLYEIEDEKYIREVTEYIYMDSLFENKPNTVLMYSRNEDQVLEYKQYCGKGVHENRIYLIPHTAKKILRAPRIGYTYQQRSFLELGYSQKFCNRTTVENGTTHWDDLNFPGFTLSLLGSWSQKRGNYFGQKALFSYNFTLINSEIGLVNYTDFKNNDLRFTIGTGISLAGRFSVLYHYSLPVLSGSFTDISRHSVSVVLF